MPCSGWRRSTAWNCSARGGRVRSCFVLRQQPAAAVAAVLDTEFGIRVQHSHGVLPDRVCLPLGPRHTVADIDALAQALQKVARGEFEGVYIHDASSGDYVALGAPARGGG